MSAQLLKHELKDVLEEALGAAIWERYTIAMLQDEFELSEGQARNVYEQAKVIKIRMGIDEWLS